MANISSAFGTIEFTSKNKDILKILVNSLAKMNGEYFTDLDSFNSSKIVKNENLYTYSDTFFGSGRWTYLNNISYYPNWIQLSDTDLNQLEQNEWTISYDFVDEESGCCVLYQANVLVEHEKNTKIKNSRITEDVTDYEYTWVNLVKLSYYDSIADYVENTYFIDDENYARWFLDDFEENRKEISDYIGCPVDDIEEILKKIELTEFYEKSKKLINV